MPKSKLHTDRLILEMIDFEDAPFIIELLNSPKWIQYIGDRKVKTIEQANAYIQRSYIHFYKKLGFGMYKMILAETEVPVGICGLVKRPYLEHHDLGFAVLPKYERRGFVFEAASAIKQFAKQDLKIPTLFAFTTQDNKASQGVLKKLDFHFDKYIRIPGDEERLLLFTTTLPTTI